MLEFGICGQRRGRRALISKIVVSKYGNMTSVFPDLSSATQMPYQCYTEPVISSNLSARNGYSMYKFTPGLAVYSAPCP